MVHGYGYNELLSELVIIKDKVSLFLRSMKDKLILAVGINCFGISNYNALFTLI